MSYLEESDHDDRGRDSGRPTPPARPAWDAATYGRTDDTRRVHPPPGQPPTPPPPPPAAKSRSRGRRASRESADAYAYAPDPYPSPAPDQYPPPAATDYPAASYGTDAYAYGADSYTSDSYGTYATESYAPDPAEAYPGASHVGSSSYDSLAASPPQEQRYAVGTLTSYPGAAADDPTPPAPPDQGRAGRNLPAAIGVGVGLAGAVLASLFLWRPAFLAVIIAAVGLGVWELVRAIRNTGANPPLIPLVAGAILMTGLAWWGQADALTFGLIVTVLAAMVWRLADGVDGYGRDVTAATLVAVYLPFLAGFAVLLAGPSDGDLRVLVTLAGVVLSDTGGYIAGSMFGRHPMAPSVSPKKSWEGLAGSLVASAVGGAVLLWVLFDVSLWWGAVFGVAVAIAAVIGDLGESLIKRDLGVKDMSRLLPGHGGIMDRLDSIVVAAPTAYVLLLLLAPPL
jgi:phosphatidate cytidylyltransferase